jgi:aryl-phospho-beta-D-glucosidase BglC (GH1 family)
MITTTTTTAKPTSTTTTTSKTTLTTTSTTTRTSQTTTSTGATCTGSFSPVSASDFVASLHPGWNLGNTLDAYPDEGSWNNPPVVASTFDMVKAAGFKSVRIPGADIQYSCRELYIDELQSPTLITSSATPQSGLSMQPGCSGFQT